MLRGRARRTRMKKERASYKRIVKELKELNTVQDLGLDKLCI